MARGGDSERIVTWRPGDLPELELRMGAGVTEPYPRHWHDEVQLCFGVAGGGALEHRGGWLATPRASLYVVAPGEVHANRADDGGCWFRSMYLPVDTWRRLAADLAGGGLPFLARPVILDDELGAGFVGLHRTLETPGARLAAGTRLLELLALLFARHAGAPPRRQPRGRARDAVRRVRDRLDDGYADNLSLDELAAVAGLSPYHLCRVFRDEVGLPPHAYQTQVRVLRAKALIRAGRPLAEVAATTGFVDQAHLSRHFKSLVKLTPGGYRRGARTYKIAAPPPATSRA